MACDSIVVIGGSAGAVETLSEVLSGLPADLPAAVLISIHTSPTGPGRLPAVLQRVCRLPVAHAVNAEPLRAGRIYVAPPDHHLVLDDSSARVTRGPKENHTRPAIDPLFRSAARSYGRRVIAVVLTGALDDGAAGLCDVKERGGLAVVQDPKDALFPDMPRNAIERNVDARQSIDYIVPRQEISAVITRLVHEQLARQDAQVEEKPVSRQMDIETRIALEEKPIDAGVLELGPSSPFTCPECHGVLLHVGGPQTFRFRCHTGHAFSTETLLATQAASTDDALWNAVRAIEERVMIMRSLANRVREDGVDGAERWSQESERLERYSESLRQIALAQGSSSPGLAGEADGLRRS